MNDKVKPALIGGVVLGLLSVIPLVNLGNACCCLWAILGGVLASYLYVKNSPTPASVGDGAITGAMAGAIGALISLVIGIPLSIALGGLMSGLLLSLVQNVDPGQADMMRRQMEAGQTVAGAIVNGIILAVCLVIFATLGGLVGIPLFEKRKANVMPPPPPPAGGPHGSGSYPG
ncbi:MAG TPA: hypothetical protein VIG25_11205 [Pyrinomonadaceae bacterium]|jgi:hypothetical protein